MEKGWIILCALWVVIIIAYNASKLFYSKDKEYGNPKKLRCDACVIDVSQRIVGSKQDRRIETRVLFDDGFKFVSYNTNRTDRFLSYTISLSAREKEIIVKSAQAAHRNACREAGLVPYSCWKCGHKGPYEGNCPQCGGAIRRYEDQQEEIAAESEQKKETENAAIETKEPKASKIEPIRGIEALYTFIEESKDGKTFSEMRSLWEKVEISNQKVHEIVLKELTSQAKTERVYGSTPQEREAFLDRLKQIFGN